MTGKYCIHCMEPMADGRCTVCGRSASEYQSLPHHLLPGTVLNGRYVIGRVLGEGGFGITYVGFDINLEVKVAVKEYYPYGIVNRNNTFSNEVTTNVSTVSAAYDKGKAKFHEEARMLARFSDLPNIVAVKDFFPFNNTEYIVMEYLEGTDLKEHIEKVGKMSFKTMFEIIEPIMTCLGKVHQKDLIHRDISPSNIMILKNGRVKLLDFGAARSSNVSDEKSLSVMLKPGYAPYEQYSSKGVQGAWTDIYALAATMYKMLTFETPETATDRVLNDELKSIRSLNPEITEAQEGVIFKAMSIMRQNRYQTVAEFKDACKAVLDTSSAVYTSSAVSSGNVSAQNSSAASRTITKEHENEWIAVFSGAIDRLNSSARADVSGGLRQNTVQPNTYAPVQNTAQPNTYTPAQNTVQPAPNQKKGSKAHVICFILNIFLPYIFFYEVINGVKLFTVETSIFDEITMSYSVVSLVLAALALIVTLIVSINSHCKNEKLRSKKPTGMLVTSLIFFAIFAFCAWSTYDGITHFDEEAANSAVSASFVCLYFMLHHLICYFVVKKMQNKNRR